MYHSSSHKVDCVQVALNISALMCYVLCRNRFSYLSSFIYGDVRWANWTITDYLETPTQVSPSLTFEIYRRPSVREFLSAASTKIEGVIYAAAERQRSFSGPETLMAPLGPRRCPATRISRVSILISPPIVIIIGRQPVLNRSFSPLLYIFHGRPRGHRRSCEESVFSCMDFW